MKWNRVRVSHFDNSMSHLPLDGEEVSFFGDPDGDSKVRNGIGASIALEEERSFALRFQALAEGESNYVIQIFLFNKGKLAVVCVPFDLMDAGIIGTRR
jgi:hypothetical protein